jgi:hypothetical protein
MRIFAPGASGDSRWAGPGDWTGEPEAARRAESFVVEAVPLPERAP